MAASACMADNTYANHLTKRKIQSSVRQNSCGIEVLEVKMAGKFTAGGTRGRGHRAFTDGDRNSEKPRLMESFSVTVSHDPAKSYIQKVACIQERTFRRSTGLTGKISVEKLTFGGKKKQTTNDRKSEHY